MPMFMTEQVARTLYQIRSPQTHVAGEEVKNPVPPGTYSREIAKSSRNMFVQRRAWLESGGFLDADPSILVVGCGYGGLIEELVGTGLKNVWGIEPGLWIWDNIDTFQPDVTIRARIANDWIGSGTEQATLLALRGGIAEFNLVIDEDAALGHTDAELPAFIDGLEVLGQENVHIVSPLYVQRGPGDSSQNWKTLNDWKAVAPDHRWFTTSGEEG